MNCSDRTFEGRFPGSRPGFLDAFSRISAAPASPNVRHGSRLSMKLSISFCAVWVRWVMYSPLTTMPHRITPVFIKALTMWIPVNMPAQALVISKTMALVKPKYCLSLIEVPGSKETKSKASYLEMLQQISRSISVGLYFDFARQSAIAFLAKSIENSVCPAMCLLLMPVTFSRGKRI